jgi:hypothetical protein
MKLKLPLCPCCGQKIVCVLSARKGEPGYYGQTFYTAACYNVLVCDFAKKSTIIGWGATRQEAIKAYITNSQKQAEPSQPIQETNRWTAAKLSNQD